MQEIIDVDFASPASTTASHQCPFNIPSCQGCEVSDSLLSAPDQFHEAGSWDEEDEAFDELVSPDSIASPTDFWSPAIFRSQLKEEFRSIFFPLCFEKDGDFKYSRYFGGRIFEPKGATWTSAIDLFCLLQMGVHRKDQALLREASKLYSYTTASLKNDLERSDAAHNDGMLAAIWILHFVDGLTPRKWRTSVNKMHKHAAEKILLSRGPDAKFSPLAKLLLYNIRMTGTTSGLVSRKPIASGGRIWAERAAWAGTIESELIEILLHITQLLHDLDELMSQSESPLELEDLYSILKDFTRTEETLICWLTRWMRTLKGEVFHYVSSSTFPHLSKMLEKHVLSAFSSVVEFPTFAIASLQISYWTGLMQVKQSILELLDMLQDPALTRVRKAALLEDLDQCADLLCQSAAFTTHPMFGYCGVLRVMAPVSFAAKWFHRREQWKKLRWTHVLSKAVQEKYQFTSPYHLPAGPGSLHPEPDIPIVPSRSHGTSSRRRRKGAS